MNSNFSTATTVGRGVSGSSSSSSNRKRRNSSSYNSTPSSNKSATTVFRKYSRKYCIPILLLAIGIIAFIQISMYNIVLRQHGEHNNSHNNGKLSPYQQRKYFEEERLKRKEQQETKIQQLQHHTHHKNHEIIKVPIKDSLSSSLRHHQQAVGDQKPKPQQMTTTKKEPKKKINGVKKENEKELELELELEDVDIHLIRQHEQEQQHENRIIKNDTTKTKATITNSSSTKKGKNNKGNTTTTNDNNNITGTIIADDHTTAAAAAAAAEEEEKQELEQERLLQEFNSNNSEGKIIHIIHTRFMQHYRYTTNTNNHQGGNNTSNTNNTNNTSNTTNTTSTNYLTILGQARLKQFLTFCLPTIQKQTNQNFIWIIKIDPLLAVDNEESNTHKLIFQPLIDAINNVTTLATTTGSNNNIYVVGSNYNFNIEGHGGSWRDGQEGEELLSISLPTTSLLNNATTSTTTSNSTNTTTNVKVPLAKLAKVYTGDMVKLRKAYDLREKLPILETRLDADDGLQYQYIERIQTIAIQRFLGTGIDIDIDSNSSNVASSSTPTPNKTTTMTRSTINNDTNSTTDVAVAAAAAAKVPDSLLRQQPPTPKWLYWCIQTQMEWHSDINTTATNSYYYGNQKKGYLSAVSNQKYCITPGVTIGYNIGINGMEVPQYQHTKLWSELHSKKAYCHDIKDKHHPISKGPCLIVMCSTTSTSTNTSASTSANGNDTDTDTDTVNNNNNNNNESQMILHAIRSRTLTSAGMNGIFVTNNSNDSNNDTNNSTSNNTVSTTTKIKMLRRSIKKSKSQQQQQQQQNQQQQQRMEDLLWKLLYYDYGIDFNRIIDTQHFLQQNSRQIAYENWLGQCSNGHSCKLKAKNDLYISYNK